MIQFVLGFVDNQVLSLTGGNGMITITGVNYELPLGFDSITAAAKEE